MTFSQVAASAVAAEAAAGWNIRGIVPSSSAKRGMKLVISRSIFSPCSIAFSSSTLGSPFEPSRRSSNGVGLQIIACSSSRASQMGKDNVQDVTTSDFVVTEEKEEEASKNAEEPTPEASISSFMADVANLVKLVDSRDIVELEMKHKDYEIVIRKKEALAQTSPPPASSPGPHVMAHTPYLEYIAPPAPSAPAASAAAAAAPPALSPSSEYPPMLSPMAGTFYRSPGPGEPQFVQVGDKVSKGQVVCIIEAMKLMNEIEADRSGTIVEIVAEDGKPVAIDSPLYVIKP